MEFIVKEFKELTTTELYEILKARADIFIIEQQINYQDMDDIDYQSIHFFFQEKNKVIAYLRAFYIDDERKIVKVGRVLTLNHGNGLGSKLLRESIPIIQDKMKCEKIYIHAQKHAIKFYEQFGFVTTSDEFLEEGVVHVSMELKFIKVKKGA